MEQTFITIHNLLPEANILFASDSIIDILGYYPYEVEGKSCFDYFHPDEVPSARSVHSRGILLDKAAVLHYLRVRTKEGVWISCECCFTVVHDVLVACTSIYREGEKSMRRALEAPEIRRLFSCSPRDPRYHMLEHLSPKFRMPSMEREPRAALILNRFTRTLTVMYATPSVATILGVSAAQVQGKSFYECIAENCLPAAIRCLESAKANDSIAYLRFTYRDPRREEDFEQGEQTGVDNDVDVSMTNRADSDSDGGAPLHTDTEIDADSEDHTTIKVEPATPNMATLDIPQATAPSRSSSGRASGDEQSRSQSSREPSFGQLSTDPTSRTQSSSNSTRAGRGRGPRVLIPPFEVEAVVSCTSDGLVVVLRKARPPVPAPQTQNVAPPFQDGLFAAPWAERPVHTYYSPEHYYHFKAPLEPQYMPVQENVQAAGGPPIDQLMQSIRDVAVFAWALVGINGKLASYSHGTPQGESQPPAGLPVWDPGAGDNGIDPPENQAMRLKRELDPHQPGLSEFERRYLSSQGYPDAYQSENSYAAFNTMHYPYYQAPSWADPSPYPLAHQGEQQSGAHRDYALPFGYEFSLPPQQGLPPGSYGHISTEPWAEASSNYSRQSSSYQAPATQPPSQDDSSQDYNRTRQ